MYGSSPYGSSSMYGGGLMYGRPVGSSMYGSSYGGGYDSSYGNQYGAGAMTPYALRYGGAAETSRSTATRLKVAHLPRMHPSRKVPEVVVRTRNDRYAEHTGQEFTAKLRLPVPSD